MTGKIVKLRLTGFPIQFMTPTRLLAFLDRPPFIDPHLDILDDPETSGKPPMPCSGAGTSKHRIHVNRPGNFVRRTVAREVGGHARKR